MSQQHMFNHPVFENLSNALLELQKEFQALHNENEELKLKLERYQQQDGHTLPTSDEKPPPEAVLKSETVPLPPDDREKEGHVKPKDVQKPKDDEKKRDDKLERKGLKGMKGKAKDMKDKLVHVIQRGGGKTFWDVACEYAGHRDGVWEISSQPPGSIAYLGDDAPHIANTLIGTASADRTARIWIGPAMNSQALVPLLGARVVQQWEAQIQSVETELAGICVCVYTGHVGSVNSIRFHRRHPRFVLTASGDCSAHIWKVPSARLTQLREGRANQESNPLLSSEEEAGNDDLFQVTANTPQPFPWKPLLMDWSVDLRESAAIERSPKTLDSSFALESNGKRKVGDDGKFPKEPAAERSSPMHHPEKEKGAPESSPVRDKEANPASHLAAVRIPQVVMAEHEDVVAAAEWMASGDEIASASWDKTVKIWNAESGDLISNFEGHEAPTTNISVHPTEPLAISSSRDCTFRTWDLRSSSYLVDVLQGHSRPVMSACFTHDGSMVISAGDDQTIKMWDVRNMEEPVQSIHCSAGINRFALSPKNGHLAAPFDDASIRIYETRGSVRRIVKIPPTEAGHRRMVCSAAWSPDETHLFSSGFDKTVLVYRVAQP